MDRSVGTRPIALFDLDGTLLPWDTQLLLANFVFQRQPWRRVFVLPVLLVLPLKLLGLVSTRFVKRLFLGFLAGLSCRQLDTLMDAFVDCAALPAMWPDMIAEIEVRRREGCLLVLNTASPQLYAEPIARRLGFDHCVSTQVEVGRKGRFPWPPGFLGPNNKRQAKIDAMRERGLIGPGVPLPLPGAWTYTDSSADLPLLRCAQHGVLVHPRPALQAIGQQEGWRELRPAPAVSRLQWVLAGVAMFFGCWNPPARSSRETECDEGS